MKVSKFIEEYGDYELPDEVVELFTKCYCCFTPKIGDMYYYINECYEVVRVTWHGNIRDSFRFRKLNVYATEKEANFVADMHHFCMCRSIPLDKIKPNQEVYYIYMCNDDKQIGYSKTKIRYEFSPFYYPSEKRVLEVINEYTFDELRRYYGKI